MKNRLMCALCALLLSMSAASAGDDASSRKLADAMAASGTAALNQGSVEKAKDLYYKALANNESCPEALFELGKLFEKENKVGAAADFYVRASRIMADEEKSTPAFVAKRADAERRIKQLNPFAARFTAMMEDYAQDLEKVTKKTPDTMTRTEALDRVDKLHLASIIAQEKMPKIEGLTKGGGAPVADKGSPNGDVTVTRAMRMIQRSSDAPTATSVPPDVEVALKKAGWTKITGKWVKKAEGIYEVTDGRLEAQKTNGAIEVKIHKGSTGTVKAFVRNANTDYYYYASGYGFAVKGTSCKLYAPSTYYYGNSNYEPYMERDDSMPVGNPKNSIMVMVTDTKLEYFLNDVKTKTANYKITKEGPFMIEVEGTAVIETPRNYGQ